MRRILLGVFLALAAVGIAASADDFESPAWKEEIAGGYLPYRKLTYDDFPPAQGIPTPHMMWTQGFVHYSYRARWTQRGSTFTAKPIELLIRSGFDQNRSWRRESITQRKALLVHEQGHLDINEIHAEEMRRAEVPVGVGDSGDAAMDDLKTKVQELFEKTNKAAQQDQDRYDRDTGHGSIDDEQEDWNKRLHQQLVDLHIKFWNDK